MALATFLIELGCALLGASIEPNGSIPGPDLDRAESMHCLTQPQPAHRLFLITATAMRLLSRDYFSLLCRITFIKYDATARVFYCVSVNHGVKVLKSHPNGSQPNEKPSKSSSKTHEAEISCCFTDSSLCSIYIGISI